MSPLDCKILQTKVSLMIKKQSIRDKINKLLKEIDDLEKTLSILLHSKEN